MVVKCMYYPKRFKQKPKGYEAGQIQKSFEPVEIEIENLADGLSHGATFKPAYLSGTKNSDWVSQQLFALDFDGGTTIQEQKIKCEKLSIFPVFGYTSFSHTETEHHFRLVFCSDKIIEDKSQRDNIQKTLIKIFDKSDKVTFDATRLFFGGKNLIQFDFNNRIDVDKILNEYDLSAKSNNGDKISIKTDAPLKAMKTIKKVVPDSKPDLNHTLKIEAIKHLDADKMRQLLKVDTNKKGNPYISINFELGGEISLKCVADLHAYIKQIDLEEYLGIHGYVNCILPEHEDDSTPSAHIYKTDDGTPVYKCFGCGHVHTITSITEKLANCPRSQAIDFIKKVYNIKIEESDWTKQWKNTLLECVKYLDSDDFILVYPQLAKLIKTRKKHIQSILLHFMDYVNEDLQVDEKPIFFSSYNKLMKITGITNRNTMAQTLTLFSLLNMIVKLPLDDKIPEITLNKAISIAAKYGHKKITGFYSFVEYGTILFEGSEIIANELKDNHMTMKGLSREYVLRTFGVETANKMYPQYTYNNEQGMSYTSNKNTEEIANAIISLIDGQGYALEKQIYQFFENKNKCETQYKKSIQEIYDTYGLVKIKASKANKIKYEIDRDIPYQSNIIVRKK